MDHYAGGQTRPLGVWLISALTVLFSLGTFALIVYIVITPNPAKAEVSAWAYIYSFGRTALNFMAGVLLFRLRKVCVALFLIDLGLSILSRIPSLPQGVSGNSIINLYIDAGVCLYIWNLREKGVLA